MIRSRLYGATAYRAASGVAQNIWASDASVAAIIARRSSKDALEASPQCVSSNPRGLRRTRTAASDLRRKCTTNRHPVEPHSASEAARGRTLSARTTDRSPCLAARPRLRNAHQCIGANHAHKRELDDEAVASSDVLVWTPSNSPAGSRRPDHRFQRG